MFGQTIKDSTTHIATLIM